MSNFTPRYTAPTQNDPLWVMTAAGGYNGCIPGAWPGYISNYPCVLPNCTGYVHGRAMEIAGVTTDNLGLSFGNAYQYWTDSSSDWIRDSEPSLGAIGVFASVGGPSPGHVYVVEEIIDADTIVISQSDYAIEYFSSLTVTRQNGWDRYGEEYVYFLGFLRNPYVTPEPVKTKNGIFLLMSKYRRRAKENVSKRIIKRYTAG